jgi:hypothetical protein
MSLTSKFFAIAFPAVVLLAADPSAPSWAVKPLSQWTEDDAAKLLADSPWIKKVETAETMRRNEVETRNSGLMGTSQGIDLNALANPGLAIAGLGGSGNRRRAKPTPILEVRWESALPVRAAELKTQEDDPPDWKGNLYAVAVYDVPGLDGNPKALAEKLRREAYLKRESGKDLRPVKVNLLPQVGGLTTVVYLFPRDEEITLADKRIEFTAIFGRFSLAQYFYPVEMQFQGKLEL